MKKMILLAAGGILIAWLAVHAAQEMLLSRNSGGRSQKSHHVRSVPAPAVGKSLETKTAADGLAAKIARLRRWASGEDRSLEREQALKLLKEWADGDAQGALEFVHGAPHIPGRKGAYAVVLSKICRTSPQAVAAWLNENVTVARDRLDIVRQVINRVDDDEPVAALTLANAAGAPEDYYYDELLRRVAKQQPQLAVESFEKMSLAARRRMIDSVAAGWARNNPEQAIAWYLGREEKNDNASDALALACFKSGRYALGDLAARLGMSEESQGLLLARLGADGTAIDPALLAGFSDRIRERVALASAGNLEDAPNQVLNLIKGAVGEARQASVLFRGWSAWLNSDRQSALDWLEQLPDKQLAGKISALWERQELMANPQGALAAVDSISSPEERAAVVHDAVYRLTWKAPGEAASWLASHPNAEVDQDAVGALTMNYLREDDAGAMAWLVKLGDGSMKDAALSAAACYWVKTEIDFATASMSAIGDVEKKEQCMFALYANLVKSDVAQADRWLEAQGVSPEVRRSWKALNRRQAAVEVFD